MFCKWNWFSNYYKKVNPFGSYNPWRNLRLLFSSVYWQNCSPESPNIFHENYSKKLVCFKNRKLFSGIKRFSFLVYCRHEERMLKVTPDREPSRGPSNRQYATRTWWLRRQCCRSNVLRKIVFQNFLSRCCHPNFRPASGQIQKELFSDAYLKISVKVKYENFF